MSQENVEAVRARYGQFTRGDFSQMADVADDFELVTTPENPDAGTYRGEAAQRWLRAWVESFEGHTIEATEIIDAGEKVVIASFIGAAHGAARTVVEGRWWQVLTCRADVVARIETFQERTQAFEAAGLSE